MPWALYALWREYLCTTSPSASPEVVPFWHACPGRTQSNLWGISDEHLTVAEIVRLLGPSEVPVSVSDRGNITEAGMPAATSVQSPQP
jgi:hypothetical protein